MKIKGLKMSRDFGFGQSDNVFGCLSEAFLLAADNMQKLKPTLGEIDIENLKILIDLSKKYGVCVGDFKSGATTVEDQSLIKILLAKNIEHV